METAPNAPYIDRVWWRARYGQNFPDLLDSKMDTFLDTAIEDVFIMFNGVKDIWKHLDLSVYKGKTAQCYGLLVAWYITDLFPDYSYGVVSTGGIPIKQKVIGGVKIVFGDTKASGATNNADLLGSLKSNAYGAKAYQMIKTSGRLNLYVRY